MEDVDVRHAKEHLEELMERAARGEEVRISDPVRGEFQLTVLQLPQERPARKPRRLGLLEGQMKVPARLLEPMTEEELKDWYGDHP